MQIITLNFILQQQYMCIKYKMFSKRKRKRTL